MWSATSTMSIAIHPPHGETPRQYGNEAKPTTTPIVIVHTPCGDVKNILGALSFGALSRLFMLLCRLFVPVHGRPERHEECLKLRFQASSACPHDRKRRPHAKQPSRVETHTEVMLHEGLRFRRRGIRSPFSPPTRDRARPPLCRILRDRKSVVRGTREHLGGR